MAARKTRRNARSLALAAMLGGGTLLGSKCDVRLHDAVFDAGRQTILSIFDPARIAEWFETNGEDQP